jgi:hypothetical protein
MGSHFEVGRLSLERITGSVLILFHFYTVDIAQAYEYDNSKDAEGRSDSLITLV